MSGGGEPREAIARQEVIERNHTQAMEDSRYVQFKPRFSALTPF
jgi:hypothetical protein